MLKTRLDNLKSNTTHWQINKYWPKALLVTSVQHQRLLRFHTAESSGRCPENYLHWLVIFFPPCPFHRRRCCCGCPLSRCLTSWDSGNIGGERSHSRVGRYEMTQAFIKVACDLTKGDADRRWDVYSAVMSFADWGDSESEVEISLTSGLAANHASWWPDTNVETDNVET